MNRTKDIETFIKTLGEVRDIFIGDYANITEKMQPYDVAAFNSELQSEYSYYSLSYFDEDKFVEIVKRKYDIDITNPVVKELTLDDVFYYSNALITLEALKSYIITNDIQTEDSNEGMQYNG